MMLATPVNPREARSAANTPVIAPHPIPCLTMEGSATPRIIGTSGDFSPDVPMMRGVAEPSMVKHGIGWGAMTGVLAADLASRGFTGVASIMRDDVYAPWLADIGQDYLLPRGITWKEYACCAWAHPALLATAEILATHEFAAA